MPPRLSRVSAPHASRSTKSSNAHASSSSNHKNNRKRKSRGLDALNIAEHTHADRTRVRGYRLGEVEGEEPGRKRRRTGGEGGDEDGDEMRAETAKGLQRKGAVDEEAGESGSDSEGGRWRVGVDEEGDDSEVDSEEAFGSGDEERFEGFTFRGSKKESRRPKGGKEAKLGRRSDFDLDEDEVSRDEVEDDDEDGFGDEGVDLATMLDDEESEGEAADQQSARQQKQVKEAAPAMDDENDDDEDMFDEDEDDEDDAPSEYSDEDKEDKFDLSEDEGSDGEDPSRQQQLQDLVKSSGPPTKQAELSAPQDRSTMLARALAALNSSTNMDPSLSREAQKLSRSIQPSSKDSKKSKLVSAPLPKRQQDTIDRAAARQETNKTLDRWVDTVKHNRRAEHLTFPLIDPHAQEPQNKTQLTATSADQPRTELERTVAAIMKESGLGPSGGKAAEKQLEGFEELQTNRLPLEEVQARRADLRKQRELMFREEIKARRIKKIKSKAYRRVHRKESQKLAQKERDLLVAAGIEGSEDEREVNDRRRAEERMGARHRESKWAKSVKASGRSAWDEEARDGVTEMARRNEELRRRQEGKREEADGFESDVESSDDDDVVVGEGDETARLQRQLGRVNDQSGEGETSKLGSLMFMQRADAARRKRNDEDAEGLRKELAGEETDDNSDEEVLPETSLGRRVFGPSEKKDQATPLQAQRAEFEEGQSSEEEEADEAVAQVVGTDDRKSSQATHAAAPPNSTGTHKAKLAAPPAPAKTLKPAMTSGAKQTNGHSPREEASLVTFPAPAAKAPNTNGWTTVNMPNGNDRADDNEGAGSDAEPNTDAIEPSNWDLVQAAFGGDDVDQAFEAEKASVASSEDEKIEDNTLPGWGSWTGTGVSKKALKRDAQRKKGRFLTKTAEGVKASDRKDAAMPRVIISEKRQKKNAKYLANQLPHPYESRTQYERGLRQPVGPEWTTKQTFQDATKPRVITKPGRAIQPMVAPML